MSAYNTRSSVSASAAAPVDDNLAEARAKDPSVAAAPGLDVGDGDAADAERRGRLEAAFVDAEYGDDGAELVAKTERRKSLIESVSQQLVAPEHHASLRPEHLAVQRVLPSLMQVLLIPLARDKCVDDDAGGPGLLHSELIDLVDDLDMDLVMKVTQMRFETRLILRAFDLWHGHQRVIEQPVRNADPVPLRVARLILSARRVAGLEKTTKSLDVLKELGVPSDVPSTPPAVPAEHATDFARPRQVHSPKVSFSDEDAAVGEVRELNDASGEGEAVKLTGEVSDLGAEYRMAADAALIAAPARESRVARMRRRDANQEHRRGVLERYTVAERYGPRPARLSSNGAPGAGGDEGSSDEDDGDRSRRGRWDSGRSDRRGNGDRHRRTSDRHDAPGGGSGREGGGGRDGGGGSDRGRRGGGDDWRDGWDHDRDDFRPPEARRRPPPPQAPSLSADSGLRVFENSWIDYKEFSSWATHLAKAKVQNGLVFSGSLDELQSFDEFKRFYYAQMSVLRVPEECRVPLLVYSLDEDARSFFLSDIACSRSDPTDKPRMPANDVEARDLAEAFQRL